MLKKGVPWNWKKQSQDAFNQAKQALMSAQLLAHYDSQKEIILTVDASAAGVGVVMSHKFAEGDSPTAYASRTLTHAERSYSSIERHWQLFLKFRNFISICIPGSLPW